MVRALRALSLATLTLSLGLGLGACAVGTEGDTRLDEAASADDRSVAAGADEGDLGDEGLAQARAAARCTTTPRTVAVEVAPLPDADVTPFVRAFDGARKSIDVLIYRMGAGPITDSLVGAARRGVDVRIIIDHARTRADEAAARRLSSAGATVRWGDTKFPYMHAKTAVVDGKTALITSSNFPSDYFERERNFVAIDRDPTDVADLETVFEADWAGKTPQLPCTRLVLAPVNARARIVDLVDSAKRELLVESMQLSDKSVRAAIKRAAGRGVSVRVILADTKWIETNKAAIEDLATANITAREMSSLDVHVKSIIVDGEQGLVGSANFSFTSLSSNREVGLVTDDAPAVATMKRTFESDWSRRAR